MQAAFIESDRVFQPQIKGVADERMADRHLVGPRNALDEIAQILQIEVMAGIEPQPAAARLLGGGGVGRDRPRGIGGVSARIGFVGQSRAERRRPGEGGRHLAEDYVGKNFLNYDFTVVLSHFKGHAMGGFGGAIKNISIGIASSAGKAWIHSAGKTKNAAEMWSALPPQDDFLESMAEAAKAVADHCGERILYINVMNNLSVDCDCDAHPAAPEMGDIGILASTDPVALDKACVDLVYASDDPGKVHLIERIESRHGTHTLDHAAAIGLGDPDYELIDIDN